MFHFYVLKSKSTGRLYRGHTKDLRVRLVEHDSGKTRSTRPGIPWEIVYSEPFCTREQAIAREKYFKTLKGGSELQRLLRHV